MNSYSRGWDNDLLESFEPSNILPITKAIADRWATISVQAQRRGRQPAVIDGLIASTAIEHGLTLATRNVKDFSGLSVHIFNPWDVK